MAQYVVRHLEIRRRLLETGITSAEQLARTGRFNPRTARRLWSGTRPVLGSTVETLAQLLGLHDFHVLVDLTANNDAPCTAQDVQAHGPPSTVADSRLLNGHRHQDIKAVLGDRRLSEHLLTGRSAPSLAAALAASVTYTPINDQHKDHPFCAAFDYNHFLGLAVVVTLPPFDDAFVIAYERAPSILHSSAVHTQGLSVLFSATPMHSLKHHERTVFDDWLHSCAHDARSAQAALLDPHRSPIVVALRHKLDISGCTARLRVFGVATNDQRQDGCRRVYTSYVLQAELQARGRGRNLDTLVSQVNAHGVRICRLKKDIHDETAFASSPAKTNNLDIVVWRSLLSDAPTVTFKSARFVRGFAIA